MASFVSSASSLLPFGSQASDTPKADITAAALAYDLLDRQKEHHAEVGILLPGGSTQIERLGKTDDPYGVHRVGSVSKTFTTFLALKLINKGFLPNGLQTRLEEIEPFLPNQLVDSLFEDPKAARKMTLEQLLSHTSGLEGDDHCREQDPRGPALSFLQDRFIQESEVGRKYKHESQPGDGFGEYSNGGVAFACLMMEVFYNRHSSQSLPFSEIIKKEVFEEIFGLKESFFAPGPTGDIIQSGAGNMSSSIQDLLQVASSLQRNADCNGNSLEQSFGVDWQKTMLKPRDLLQHYGL